MTFQSSSVGMLSTVISVHNEDSCLAVTIDSIRRNTQLSNEIIVVDDASTDGCCDKLIQDKIKVIRHNYRRGVAPSRNEAIRLAFGNVFAIFDGHQSVTPGCVDQCFKLAIEREAIVTPEICGIEPDSVSMHGAYFVCRDNGPPFGAEWKLLAPEYEVTSVNSLRAPAYVIPASVYPKVAWSPLLRGWGGSEACVSLKAFFTGVPILHLCGPIAYHKFKTKFHYPVTWDEIWRNHALIARICFSDRTWYDYWLPKIFEPHLNAKVQREMDSPEVRDEQRAFQKLKVRPDHEFWTRLVFRAVPKMLRIE